MDEIFNDTQSGNYIEAQAQQAGDLKRQTEESKFVERIKNINERIQELKKDGGDTDCISDGWHSFGELYFHRMVLFDVILEEHKDRAWKSWLHHDGTMFDGDFIVGVETPMGQYTYHYNAEWWDVFNVRELDKAPEYDGHQPEDVIRLLSLVLKD